MAEKKYVSDNAQLMAEWDWENNTEYSPYNLTFGSNRKVGWICEHGHKWDAVIAHRTRRNSGCPFCSGRMAISGINDLQTLFPHLSQEWHPTKNDGLCPNTIAAFSGKKVWWRCAKGHEWPATVINRSKRGSDCPFCSGREAILGETDLATTNPKLAAEWHPLHNNGLRPQDVSAGSHKKVWWICSDCGNEWIAEISSRNAGRGCSICSGKQKSKTLNKTQLMKTGSLLDNNPTLAAEWHPTKNGELLPSQVLPNANRKVWWQCEKGHEWPAIIQSRNKGAGCPRCSNELQTSFPEQAILFYAKQVTKAYSRYIIAPRTEVDIYLPDFNIAIEYDGIRFHGSMEAQEKEERKNVVLSNLGIILFRVKETDSIEPVQDTEHIIYCQYSTNFTYLNIVITKLFFQISKIIKQEILVDVNVERDRAEIYSQYVSTEKANSLLIKQPKLAAEWHPSLNGKLLPTHVSEHSNKVVYWLCSNCGHEWKTGINNRSNGTGCPNCSRLAAGTKRVSNMVLKRGSLASKHPHLANEWHPTKNNGLQPTDVTASSNKNAVWLCSKCGHEWEAIICSRSRGNGCPQCARKKKIIPTEE